MPKFLLTLLLSLLPLIAVNSQSEDKADSIRVSLLTCSAGDESYTYYGHTALRIVPFEGKDVVVNYGLFSFQQPNFTWRFILGEPNYTVGLQFTKDFYAAYEQEGRNITEQQLNLTQSEAKALLAFVTKNLANPTWSYRYNFLYDNCTTRILDALKNVTNDKIQIVEASSSATQRAVAQNKKDIYSTTYRQLIWKAAYKKSPWIAFGQDLLLGYEIDQPISLVQSATFPMQALIWAEFSHITHANGITEPLVAEKHSTSFSQHENSHFFLTPEIAGFIFLFLVLVVTAFSWFGYKKPGQLLDNGTLFVQGVVGCIIAFMFFFSAQPGVDTNMLVWLFNPLPLVYLPIKIWREAKDRSDYWMKFVQLALILITLVTCRFVKAQEVNTALFTIIVAMLLRCLFQDISKHKTKKLAR